MKKVYILCGENEAAIYDYQQKLAKSHLKDELDDFSYVKLNMLENSIDELLYECKSSGLFSTKKVVVAENCLFLTSTNKKTKVDYRIDKLQEYLINSNDNVILVLKCGEIDNRKKIVKDVKKYGEVKVIDNFTFKELSEFVINTLNYLGIKIDKETVSFLLEYSNLDFGGVKKELEKLELLDKKEITKEDIKNIIVRSIEYDIFSLTNELFSKNYTKFREIYEILKINKEEPIYLLSLIVSQLRLYYKVKILLIENYNQKDISTKLGVHPYRVQLATGFLYNINIEQLYKAIILCKETDKELKTSPIDKYISLDIFFNKIIELFK